MRAGLHITNGDSAAGTMREAGIGSEILPWRDVLHDGPVPGGLELSELSRVRASYLASIGLGEVDSIYSEFARRDAILVRFVEYDPVTLWFEWDLYDQLQLIQILDFLSRANDAEAKASPTLEIVSVAGYLGNLPAEAFSALYERRSPVTRDMLLLGRSAWLAFTSPEPYDTVALMATDTSSLPFLGAALVRLLEELPSIRDGLARSERQLLQGIADGKTRFGDLFQDFASREERIYCGDSSAALYLERLSRGTEPLVCMSFRRSMMPRNPGEGAAFRNAELVLTDAGRAVLAGDRDWIEMGGSDRWLGGIHLDGRNVAWRWDPNTQNVIDAPPS